MKHYTSLRHYKPDHWSFWEWCEFIDELRGDCDWNEGIEVDTDEEGHEFYRRYIREGDCE